MMDAYWQRTSQQSPLSTANGHVNGGLLVDPSIQPAACALCRRIIVSDNDDLENISICGDCKILLLEDHGTPTRDLHQRRRQHRGRRTMYSSSESIENLFSQQFSQMINLVRQNHSAVSGNEDQSVDGDAAARLFQHTSSRTTPSGSRRWQRVFSDTESEGFDTVDSLYGESETNLRSSRYRVFQSESDAISFSAYGGDSDASMDGHSFLDRDMFIQAGQGSILDSDTDIDPMHAGLNQWNSDDPEEEEEEEEDGEWEEADMEEDTVDSVEAGAQVQNLFLSSPIDGNFPGNWHRQHHSPEFEGLIHWRGRRGRPRYNHDIFNNLEEVELPQNVGNSGNYVRRFEELFEALAESDSTRRGAPPAAVSFLNSLPRVIINEEHEKHDDGLACAICKDVLTTGTEVNQLPCHHLYHPFCILPWLSARNSCPLCRYELPTDDNYYEEGKRNASVRMGIQERQQQDVSEDSSLNDSDGAEADEPLEFDRGRMEQRELLDIGSSVSRSSGEGSRRWFFLAAAPIVSLFGIVLVLWLGNPQGRGPTSQCNIPASGLHQIQVSGPSTSNQRGDRRRWWSLF